MEAAMRTQYLLNHFSLLMSLQLIFWKNRQVVRLRKNSAAFQGFTPYPSCWMRSRGGPGLKACAGKMQDGLVGLRTGMPGVVWRVLDVILLCVILRCCFLFRCVGSQWAVGRATSEFLAAKARASSSLSVLRPFQRPSTSRHVQRRPEVAALNFVSVKESCDMLESRSMETASNMLPIHWQPVVSQLSTKVL